MVERLDRNVPVLQCLLGHVGGEFDGMQVLKAALPFGKRRAPVSAVRHIDILEC
jgi:hypothetical protein